jgi:hypothetical protein
LEPSGGSICDDADTVFHLGEEKLKSKCVDSPAKKQISCGIISHNLYESFQIIFDMSIIKTKNEDV